MSSTTKQRVEELEQPLIDDKPEAERDEALPTCEALGRVAAIAKNVIIGSLFHPMYSIVNALVLGHQDTPEPLAGLGLGSLTVGLIGLSIGQSFAGGVGTFIAQSFGQGDLRLCAVYRNRMIFLSSCLFVFLFTPTLFISKIYTAIGQDPEVAAYGAQYVHTVMPFVYFYLVSQAYASYSMNQRVTAYSMRAMIAGTLAHASMVGIFYFWLDWGFAGICWATALMFVVRCSMNVLQVEWGDQIQPHADVHLCSQETVSNLGPLLSICSKQLAMSVWGWWAFDIFTLMATYLGRTVTAAQTIMRSIGLLTFMFPVGFAAGCGILVGNSIGAKKPKLAMQFYRVSLAASTAIAGVQIVALHYAKSPFHTLFTDQEAVKAQLSLAWPVLLLFTFFDTTQAVSGAVVRACGKQGVGAFVTSTAYWGCGIPLSYYFGFKAEYGIKGLWFGPTFATFLMSILYNAIIGCIDWPDLLEQMEKRREAENAIVANLGGRQLPGNPQTMAALDPEKSKKE